MGSGPDKVSSRQRPLVAVVDDNARVIESLGNLLQAAGYETLLCESAEAYLASQQRENVDALVTDIGLAGISGIELLRQLHDSGSCPPAFLVTGRLDAARSLNAQALGALQLFVKPIDTNELLAAIARELSRRR